MIVDSTHVIDGLSTRVRVSGEGRPLLLIGGLWSQAPMFDPVLPYLDGFRTIAFDPPGIGKTDLPTRPYSVQRLAQFAVGVLAAVGVGRADVLGVSLGGAVAQELAHAHPERVDRLVLVSTGPGTIAVPGRLDILVRFGRPTAYTNITELEQRAGQIFGGRLREHPELVRGWHLRPPASKKAWLYRLAGTTGWSSLPFLHSVTQPTLVIHGDDDPIIPLVNARIMSRLLPHATLHVYPDGHLGLVTMADELGPLVSHFLNAS